MKQPRYKLVRDYKAWPFHWLYSNAQVYIAVKLFNNIQYVVYQPVPLTICVRLLIYKSYVPRTCSLPSVPINTRVPCTVNMWMKASADSEDKLGIFHCDQINCIPWDHKVTYCMFWSKLVKFFLLYSFVYISKRYTKEIQILFWEPFNYLIKISMMNYHNFFRTIFFQHYKS